MHPGTVSGKPSSQTLELRGKIRQLPCRRCHLRDKHAKLLDVVTAVLPESSRQKSRRPLYRKQAQQRDNFSHLPALLTVPSQAMR